MLTIVQVCISTVLFFDSVTGFVLYNTCAAPSPCTCDTISIQCDNKQLAQFPTFIRHIEHSAFSYVYLRFNQLTSVPAYAFKNLSATTATDINIYLSNNHISQIHLQAFDGIENLVTILDLSNNNLTQLPQPLTSLTSLQTLSVLNNPLLTLDATVMSKVGITLNQFSVSFDRFSTFPIEMKYLKKLTSLTMNKINASMLDFAVFPNCTTTLSILEMSHAVFETIPRMFCQLTRVNSFILDYSPNLRKHNSSIFHECTRQMPSLSTLSLRYNQLSKFPKINSVFPDLEFLDLSHNEIHLIESTSLSGLKSLLTLGISYNRFSRIPAAVNKLTNLQSLYIDYNQIDSVDDFDLQNLHKITYIRLSDNPLVYLSSVAFSHNPLLREIDLSRTKLGHIPRTILSLDHLTTIWLDGAPIECSCGAMSYLKSWNLSTSITGKCSTGENVESYLQIVLPHCP